MRSDGEKLISFQVNAQFLAEVDRWLEKLPKYRGNRTSFIKDAIIEKLKNSAYLKPHEVEILESLAAAPSRARKGGNQKFSGPVLTPEQLNDKPQSKAS